MPSSADLTAALVGEGIDPAIASFAARAAQGHLGRARRLATDEEARSRRADVLRLPTRLGGLAERLAPPPTCTKRRPRSPARPPPSATSPSSPSSRPPSPEGGRQRARTASVKVRGAAGAVKELQKRQKSRASRGIRDVLDHALVDLAAWYRDVLAIQVGRRRRSRCTKTSARRWRRPPAPADPSRLCAYRSRPRVPAVAAGVHRGRPAARDRVARRPARPGSADHPADASCDARYARRRRWQQ